MTETTSTNAGALYRLLRALASVGIFAEGASRQFSTPTTFLESALSLTILRNCRKAMSSDSTLIVVYKGADVLMRARSTDGGQTWEKPVAIATSAKRPDVIRKVKKFEVYPGTADVLPDDRMAVTWKYIADDSPLVWIRHSPQLGRHHAQNGPLPT